MADQEIDSIHFNKLFWFCVAAVGIGILFLISLCYIPVPKSSERFADNVQGFIEGSVVTAALAFLLGGNLPTKKQPDNTVTTNTDTGNVVELFLVHVSSFFPPF